MILVDGLERDDVKPSIDEVKSVLTGAHGDQGIFGRPVFSDDLVEQIGLEEDSNSNLSRRMLFLLESVPATGNGIYETVREQLLDRYLDDSVKNYRTPRFLLNDVIRYWRTMAVDFAGKEHQDPEKWGLRNAKLRTSRKILFAGGLLPIFGCAEFSREEMPRFLNEQLETPPTDRIAKAFLDHDAADVGGRALGAYDDFLALLHKKDAREELASVTRASSKSSKVFQEASRLGDELEHGLLALLFETRGTLPKLVREYGIF